MEPNYRRIYQRLKRRFPVVLDMVHTPGVLKSYDDIPLMFDKFCRLAHMNHKQVIEDHYKRLIYIAAITRMEDPHYFEDDNPIRKGMATEIGKVLGCHQTVVSHALRTVKNYLEIYPQFREELDYFYNQMTEE